MPELQIPEMGITITVDRSTASDHAPVIFIDTDERLGEEGPMGPKIRVNVNDGEVFHGVDRGEEPEQRLEYLRGQLRAECISWGELAELQALAEHIAADDVELREAAGLPEFPEVVE
jgi:hypothetical protein